MQHEAIHLTSRLLSPRTSSHASFLHAHDYCGSGAVCVSVREREGGGRERGVGGSILARYKMDPRTKPSSPTANFANLCFFFFFALIVSLCSLTVDTGVMERLNSKLYLENCYIIKENERLRRKAAVLDQENKKLFSQIKQNLSCKGNCSASTATPQPVLPDLNIPLSEENPTPACANKP